MTAAANANVAKEVAWHAISVDEVSVSTTTVSDGEIRDCSCFLCQEN